MQLDHLSLRGFSMAISLRVKTKFDDKIWKKIARGARRVKSASVRIGWWGSYYADGTSVAQVVAWNEEGHWNGGMFAGTYTPPRPAVRTMFVPASREILKRHATGLFKSIETGNIGGFWESLSENLKDKMKESILDFQNPKNSPVTVAFKGFNDPLIETGTSYDSIKSMLVRFGGGV